MIETMPRLCAAVRHMAYVLFPRWSSALSICFMNFEVWTLTQFLWLNKTTLQQYSFNTYVIKLQPYWDNIGNRTIPIVTILILVCNVTMVVLWLKTLKKLKNADGHLTHLITSGQRTSAILIYVTNYTQLRRHHSVNNLIQILCWLTMILYVPYSLLWVSKN